MSSDDGDQLDRRRRRAAQNQSMFREVNERIEELSQQLGLPVQFVCECLDTSCDKTVALSISEYERVRADPGCFVVAPGHEVPDVEDIVEGCDGYLVVRKFGTGYEMAARLDPRRTPGGPVDPL